MVRAVTIRILTFFKKLSLDKIFKLSKVNKLLNYFLIT